MKHCITSLLLVACGPSAHGVEPTGPITQSPPEHDTQDNSYRCVCNKQDVGTCSTVYVRHSEAKWYVNFQFQNVVVLKRATECKPLIVNQERQS